MTPTEKGMLRELRRWEEMAPAALRRAIEKSSIGKKIYGDLQERVADAKAEAHAAGREQVELGWFRTVCAEEMGIDVDASGDDGSHPLRRALRELAKLREAPKSQMNSAYLLEVLSGRGGPEAELGRAGLTAIKKTADYDNGLSRDRYFPLGLASYAQMLHIKSERLLSFARSPREALNEPVMDTLHDLINYASFAADWQRRTA